jgi:DNA-directed RNA polymerase subunit RPC12/RpoP
MMRDLTGIAKPCPMCGSKRIYMLYSKIDVIYSVHIIDKYIVENME